MTVPPLSTDSLAAELMLRDVTHLKALADPLRVRILKGLWEPVDGDPTRLQPCTAKELLRRIGEQKTTRIYHHLKVLLAAGVIQKIDRVAKGNLIEDYFAPTARVVRIAPELLEGEIGEGSAWRDPIIALLDATRRDVLDLNPSTRVDALRFSHREFALTAEEAARFRERLDALIAEFEGNDRRSEDGDATYRLLVVAYPARSSS